MKKVWTGALGRRKTSVARVYAKPGSGEIEINGLPSDTYFGRATLRMLIRQPLVAAEKSANFDIKINVKGGGLAGQAGAVRHGIARVLVKLESGLHAAMRAGGFLTRDSREVERKKYGHHKARRRPQYSKR